MDITSAVTVLTALGHETRLTAFRELVQAGAGGLSVGELRNRVQVPPATLTAHLNGLRAAGLVSDTREGRSIFVSADYPRMQALIDFLTENCCAGRADCLEPRGCLGKTPDKGIRS